MDKKRKKKLSNKEWLNPHDPQARITKLKDGRTHLAYKNQQTVDLDTGAVVAVVVHPGDRGDSQSFSGTLKKAEQNLVSSREGEAANDPESHIEEAVGDNGYHSNQVLLKCQEQGIRTYFSEPKRGRRKWKGSAAARRAVYANLRRIRKKRGKGLLRRRGELLERPFRHRLDLGGMRRAHARGLANVHKREYIAASAQNLGLLTKHQYRMGTPRSRQDGRALSARLHQAQQRARQATPSFQQGPRRSLRDPPPSTRRHVA